jgi:hypothetical protein
MIGRRTIVGLSLLCALVFCAFAASSAQALQGTTAFTCVPVTAGTGDFTDAHCKNGAKGDFKAEEVTAANTETVGTNEKTKGPTTEPTPVKLESTFNGVTKVVIECQKATTTGTSFNNEVAAGEHMLVKGLVVFTYSECTMPKPVNKGGAEACQVNKKVFLLGGEIITEVEEKAMYVNFRESGKELGSITIENKSECPPELTKAPLSVKGTAAADGDTATLTFPSLVTTSSVKLGGSAATLSSSITVRRKEQAGKEQPPIFFKTTTK